MAILRDAKDQFYSHAEDVLGEELKQVLHCDEKKLEFYELCKKFADIALNAPKIKSSQMGEVEGCFQFKDINIAKAETMKFVKKYSVGNIESFMESIYRLHEYAVDWDDTRAKSGFVQSEASRYSGGVLGVYYNFQRLPDSIWEDICEEIIEEIYKD